MTNERTNGTTNERMKDLT